MVRGRFCADLGCGCSPGNDVGFRSIFKSGAQPSAS